jgi:hypothetical protein
MAAPKHNKNARKWTASRVLGHLAEITAIATDPKEYFLGTILERIGLYRDVWAYWRQIFAGHDEIMNEMDLIKDRFEVNLFQGSLRGELPAGFAIMNLKLNYGWREKHKPEQSETDNAPMHVVHSDLHKSNAA